MKENSLSNKMSLSNIQAQQNLENDVGRPLEVWKANEVHVVRIVPSKEWISLCLSVLWQYRQLFCFLTWRDIKVRYKQTVLGAAWAIIQPFSTKVLLSFFLRSSLKFSHKI
jgi:hypothetical protein